MQDPKEEPQGATAVGPEPPPAQDPSKFHALLYGFQEGDSDEGAGAAEAGADAGVAQVSADEQEAIRLLGDAEAKERHAGAQLSPAAWKALAERGYSYDAIQQMGPALFQLESEEPITGEQVEEIPAQLQQGMRGTVGSVMQTAGLLVSGEASPAMRGSVLDAPEGESEDNWRNAIGWYLQDAGNDLANSSKVDPILRGSTMGQTTEALGSSIVMMLPALATGGSGALATGAIAGTSASAEAASGYYRTLEETGSEEKAMVAGVMYGLAGATEAVGLGRFTKRLGAPLVAADKKFGGILKKTLLGGSSALREFGKDVGINTAQEMFQNAMMEATSAALRPEDVDPKRPGSPLAKLQAIVSGARKGATDADTFKATLGSSALLSMLTLGVQGVVRREAMREDPLFRAQAEGEVPGLRVPFAQEKPAAKPTLKAGERLVDVTLPEGNIERVKPGTYRVVSTGRKQGQLVEIRELEGKQKRLVQGAYVKAAQGPSAPAKLDPGVKSAVDYIWGADAPARTADRTRHVEAFWEDMARARGLDLVFVKPPRGSKINAGGFLLNKQVVVNEDRPTPLGETVLHEVAHQAKRSVGGTWGAFFQKWSQADPKTFGELAHKALLYNPHPDIEAAQVKPDVDQWIKVAQKVLGPNAPAPAVANLASGMAMTRVVRANRVKADALLKALEGTPRQQDLIGDEAVAMFAELHAKLWEASFLHGTENLVRVARGDRGFFEKTVLDPILGLAARMRGGRAMTSAERRLRTFAAMYGSGSPLPPAQVAELARDLGILYDALGGRTGARIAQSTPDDEPTDIPLPKQQAAPEGAAQEEAGAPETVATPEAPGPQEAGPAAPATAVRARQRGGVDPLFEDLTPEEKADLLDLDMDELASIDPAEVDRVIAELIAEDMRQGTYPGKPEEGAAPLKEIETRADNLRGRMQELENSSMPRSRKSRERRKLQREAQKLRSEAAPKIDQLTRDPHVGDMVVVRGVPGVIAEVTGQAGEKRVAVRFERGVQAPPSDVDLDVQLLTPALARRLKASRGIYGPGSYRVIERRAGASRSADEIPRFAPASQLESAAFRKWFGNSVVREEDGSPRVMYHGTRRRFSDPNAFRSDVSVEGVHFGTKAQATEFVPSPEWGVMEDARIYPVYLKIENPIRLRDHGGWNWEQLGEQLIDKGVFTDEQVADFRARGITTRDALESEGYDGIVYLNRYEPNLPLSVLAKRFRLEDDSGTDTFDKRRELSDFDFKSAIHEAEDSYVVFDPGQVKSAIGNVGTYDRRVSDLRYAGMTRVVRPPSFQNLTPITQPMSEGEKAITYLQDTLRPLRSFEKQVEQRTGQRLPDNLDPYLAEELRRRKTLDRVEKLSKTYVEPMVQALKEGGITLEEAEEYAYAQHAEEANAYLASINQGQPGLSGMSDAAARAIKAKWSSDSRLAAMQHAHDLMRQLADHKLDLWVHYGLESQDFVDQLRRRYQNYIPLKTTRVDEGPNLGRGLDVRGRHESLRRLGRGSLADNPLSNLLVDAESAVIRGEKNLVLQRLAALLRASGDPGFAQVNAPQLKKGIDPSGQVGLVGDPMYRLADNVVAFKEEGRTSFITFNEAFTDVAKALHNADAATLGRFGTAMREVNRYLAGTLTRWNLAFLPVNVSRDVGTGFIHNLEQGYDFAVSATKRVPSAWVAALKYARGIRGTSQIDRYYQEYVESGGPVSTLALVEHDVGKRADKLLEEIEGFGSNWARTKAGVKAVFDFVGLLNDAGENGTRFASYVEMRERGETAERAASYAKNLTTNFERGGQIRPTLGALYLFANAGIQGTARSIQAAAHPRVRRALALGAVGMIALDALNRGLSGEDEEGTPYYDKIPDWKKRNNLILMTPWRGEGAYVALPLPQALAPVFYAGTAIGDVVHGKKGPLEAFGSITKSAFDAWNVLGGGSDVVETLSPTWLDPLYFSRANRTPFDTPLMPVTFDDDTPRSQRYWSTTAPALINFSRWLNRVSGGDDVRSGALDFSPEEVALFIRTLTGGIGTESQRALGALQAGMDPKREVNVEQIPALRRFVGNVEGDDRYDKNLYYTQANEVKRYRSMLKRYTDRGDAAGVARLRRDYPGYDKLAEMASKINSRLQKAKRAGSTTEELRLMQLFNSAYAEVHQ